MFWLGLLIVVAILLWTANRIEYRSVFKTAKGGDGDGEEDGEEEDQEDGPSVREARDGRVI